MSHGGSCANTGQPSTHFIGIGGAGMSAIARVMNAAGIKVQGSDRSTSRTTEILIEDGIPVFIGHDARNIGEMERIVYTRAVPEDNPELTAASRKGLPVVERAEMLGQLYDLFSQRVSVTGTHGKTTTSAMLSMILVVCGKDPTVLIGGEAPDLQSGARLGESGMIVAEACEAYSSFLHLKSSLALVTNVDEDHFDWYHNFDNVKQSFVDFMKRVDQSGVIVACADDGPLMSLKEKVDRQWLTYGFSDEADCQIIDLKQTPDGQKFSIINPGWHVEVTLPIKGRHMASNATGAIVSAIVLGCDPQLAAGVLASFRGVGRRMELKGRQSGITVYDDYAHHPTEIEATLSAAQDQFNGALTVVFQPHLYSRTAEHLEQFARVLQNCDRLVLTNVYPARETPDKGVQTDSLYNLIKNAGMQQVYYVPDLPDVTTWLEEHTSAGDTVMTMGAGDVFKAGEELLVRLKSAEEVSV